LTKVAATLEPPLLPMSMMNSMSYPVQPVCFCHPLPPEADRQADDKYQRILPLTDKPKKLKQSRWGVADHEDADERIGGALRIATTERVIPILLASPAMAGSATWHETLQSRGGQNGYVYA